MSPWWEREIRVTLTLWPRWLARWIQIKLGHCKCSMLQWKVDAVTVSNVPEKWHCLDCGKGFTRNMDCPVCGSQLRVIEHMGMFSWRFNCSTCKTYYSREDLV